ncbi:hypothetical protein ADL15_18220 [Actinoplanes awajinensis subsp. mycoplanecinus]|uniref:Uncharacterized protein n=1 Tax=Actinoplanes awajinensis subsp. mycoplanecinus TaxID=135947 RepID=A0A101JU03_9ACTN|nr:hypothetical protein ADL15_18220 [Actinoplanes awajinensis subsp. mycoplanecinus]
MVPGALGQGRCSEPAAAYQAANLPRGVETAQRLFREAARQFEAVGAPPTHILRVLHSDWRTPSPGMWGSLREKLDPPEDRFEKAIHAWRFDRYFLGADGHVYRVSGEQQYQIHSLEEARNAKRAPTPSAVRGLLKLGLVPGDQVIVLGSGVGKYFEKVDLRSKMYASPTELPPYLYGDARFSPPSGSGTSQPFVTSPNGTIYLEISNYDNTWYESLEEVLAEAIVRQRR